MTKKRNTGKLNKKIKFLEYVMKKKILTYIFTFMIVIAAVKIVDIHIRYDVGIIDYIKYSMPLTEKEKQYIKSHKVKYGININDAPFAFLMKDSMQSTGIMVDYFNQLSVTLESDFQPVVYDRYNLGIELKKGNIDCSVLNKTKMNTEIFSFTQTLYTERSKVLVGGNSKCKKLSDIKNMKIAVISGSTAHHVANEFFKPDKNVTLVLAGNLDDCFRMFGLDEVDAIIGDEAKISYYINQALKSNRFRFIDEAISEEDVAVAVNKDQKLLFNILNKGILDMKKNNQYSHINSKWFGSFVPEVNDMNDGGKRANVILIIAFVILVSLIWNKSVAKQVTIKTKQLQNSRKELHEIIDSLSDGIVVNNTQGKILYANRTFAGLVGMEFEKVFEKYIDKIDTLKPFISHANDAEPFQIGDRYYLSYKKQINLDSEETLFILKDYTERYRYEKLNKQEAKMIAIGELSAGLAHEIRNPLAIIRTYLYILSKKIDDCDGKEAVSVMVESVERINLLIENLLGFSKLSKDQFTKINVKQSISTMVSIKKKELNDKNIKLNILTRIDNDKELLLNEDVFKLCVANMITNAIDAFDNIDISEKTIDIEINAKNKKLYVEFRDNGCGIESDIIENIFNPFYTTKENGTGLGLYMIQSEIRKIGGTIKVKSIIGKGTSFYIEFPIGKEK